MVSGYGANLIFLNKKIKDWTSRMVANPHVQQHLISCLIHPPHPPSRQSGRHSYVYHPLQKAGFSIILKISEVLGCYRSLSEVVSLTYFLPERCKCGLMISIYACFDKLPMKALYLTYF